jgi:hypothetical protein
MNHRISFYLPRADWPAFEAMPTPRDLSANPRLFLSPALNWTWRTYLHLGNEEIECEMVDTMPPAGIIFCAACNIPLLYRPNDRQLIVCCVADSPTPFYTQFNVYQCATQSHLMSQKGFPHAAFMPHWPQPGLQPRSTSRGSRFENIDYFGAADQLAPELHDDTFRAAVKSLGLNFRCHYDFYHDYTETDAVLAIRHFHSTAIVHKPASKLVNAWLAGVPSILGKESAFSELRRSPYDYLEAISVAGALQAVERLRQDHRLRVAMTDQGNRRARDFTEKALTAQWRNLLATDVPELFERWTRMGTTKQHLYFASRASARLGRSLWRRLSRRVAGR